MKESLIALFGITLVTSCAQLEPSKSASKWLVECGKSLDVESSELKVDLQRGQKRCEYVRTDLIQNEKPFSVSLQLIPLTVTRDDDQWHSVLQIHSFPDESLGERWRCPIISLEVKNGMLRMFNRWDASKVSILQNGTCAGDKNSIRSTTVFEGLPLSENEKYEIKIDTFLSTEIRDAYLKVSVNNIIFANIYGANKFNDARAPYLKFGVYKPTSWSRGVQSIKYVYKNVVFNSDDNQQYLLGDSK